MDKLSDDFKQQINLYGAAKSLEASADSTQKPVFKDQQDCSLASDILLKTPLVPYDRIDFSEFSSHQPELITDDNMITEYKYGKGL